MLVIYCLGYGMGSITYQPVLEMGFSDGGIAYLYEITGGSMDSVWAVPGTLEG